MTLAEPGLRKYTLITLRKLCENSALYPESYVLNSIENISFQNSEGGFGDIYQGHYKGRVLCLKVVRLFQKVRHEILKVRACFFLSQATITVLLLYDTRPMPEKRFYGVNSTILILHHFMGSFILMRHGSASVSYPLGWKMETLSYI